DLLGEFRALAPARPPIVLQRWSIRRVSLALGMLLVVGVASAVSVNLFFPVENIGASAPDCGTGHAMILTAQAVPSADLLPCVAYEFRFRPGASPVLAVAADSALAFQPRSSLVRHVRQTENLLLCGRGAACPG